MTYEETQKIKHLRKVTSVMVEESSNGIECTKNRFWNRTMDGFKNVTFEKIELSKIDNDIPHIRREYYEKNNLSCSCVIFSRLHFTAGRRKAECDCHSC